MRKTRYLESLIHQQQFRFHRLVIEDIDNQKVAAIFSPEILREEYCLFSNAIFTGDQYVTLLHQRIISAIQNRNPLPVVRFADGEYAFYRYTLGCNGLYKQAESVDAIRKVMPQHVAALTSLASRGLLAPLIFPGNSQIFEHKCFSLKKDKRDASGAEFLNFLLDNQISLTADNYIPFYVVYAYLSSPEFALALNGKNVCILNSDNNQDACQQWFARHNSIPNLNFINIPREYVATQWEDFKKSILSQISDKTDICIVGAGVGALLICSDIAEVFSLPVVDAGHVLNMMNDRVEKSNGCRLYTIRKKVV